ncbi:MAG TPA: MBL fold metallo-hydrolase [Gaiellales bacterium]|nr:MBL fold metallo-hydrolase [Gaiellales bacterium]
MPDAQTTVTPIGGPTALLTYGGLRILTDPTFDEPGDHPRPGSSIILRKLTGPAIEPGDVLPIDLVLLSHDHHADNLDDAGREFLPHAGTVLTTTAGAERLGGNAVGLEPGRVADLDLPGGAVQITAVDAHHGSPEMFERNGPVLGFVLRGDDLPTIYVTGDNASVDVVREIATEHGPFDAAILFAGGAQVPERWGDDVLLTLDAAGAAEAAAILSPATIVPIHQEGWAHFTSSPADLARAFAAADVAGRLRSVAPGETAEL